MRSTLLPSGQIGYLLITVLPLEPAATPGLAGVLGAVDRYLGVPGEHPQEPRHRPDVADRAAAEGQVDRHGPLDLAVVAFQLVLVVDALGRVLPGRVLLAVVGLVAVAVGIARGGQGTLGETAQVLLNLLLLSHVPLLPGSVAFLPVGHPRVGLALLGLSLDAVDGDADAVDGRDALGLERTEDGVVDEIGVLVGLLRLHALGGFVHLLVQQRQVPLDLVLRLVGHVTEHAGDIGARDGGSGGLGGSGRFASPGAGLVVGVDPQHRPVVGGLVAVLAGGVGVREGVVGRVAPRSTGCPRSRAGAGRRSATPGCGDEVVRVEVLVLVPAAVDGERALRRAAALPGLLDVGLDLRDVDEQGLVGSIRLGRPGITGREGDRQPGHEQHARDPRGHLRTTGNVVPSGCARHGSVTSMGLVVQGATPGHTDAVITETGSTPPRHTCVRRVPPTATVHFEQSWHRCQPAFSAHLPRCCFTGAVSACSVPAGTHRDVGGLAFDVLAAVVVEETSRAPNRSRVVAGD